MPVQPFLLDLGKDARLRTDRSPSRKGRKPVAVNGAEKLKPGEALLWGMYLEPRRLGGEAEFRNHADISLFSFY